MAVRTEEGDAVPGLNARREKSARQTRGTPGKARIREALLSADDADLAGKLIAGIAQKPEGSQGKFHMRLTVSEKWAFSEPASGEGGRRRMTKSCESGRHAGNSRADFRGGTKGGRVKQPPDARDRAGRSRAPGRLAFFCERLLRLQ